MNSLYQLDPKWKRLLTSDNFLGGLTVHEYVQEISEDYSLKNTAATNTWEHLDPKPYVRTFESTLRELKKLQNETGNEREQLERDVSRQELIHANRVMLLSQKLRTIVNHCAELDESLSTVSQSVSPLGEQLEKAIKRKNIYINSTDLLSHYSMFYQKGHSKELEALRRAEDWELKAKAATIMRNLLLLTKKIETRAMTRSLETTSNIEKRSEIMENELLIEFNSAYRQNDFEKLSRIALILDRLNGGVNVIQSFINQHEYFLDEGQLDHDKHVTFSQTFKEELGNPDCHGPFYEPGIVEKLETIKGVVKEESEIVLKVFEVKSQQVMQLFIQRIYAQKIQFNVEYLLSASLTVSNLAYARMLHAVYSLLHHFSKDLCDFFQNSRIERSGLIVATLEHCNAEILSSKINDLTNYAVLEKRSLESIMTRKCSSFLNAHEKEIRSGTLSSKLLSIPQHVDEADPLASNRSTSGRFTHFNNLFKHYSERDKKGMAKMSDQGYDVSEQQTAEDDKFSLKIVDGMMKCAVESIARAMELIPGHSYQFCLSLVEILLSGTVGSYIECGLEVSFHLLLKSDMTKDKAVNLSHLEYVTKSTEMLSLVSTSIKTVVLPLLGNTSAIKKDVISLTNSFLKRCELMSSLIIEETIEVCSRRFAYSLSKQKKKDFLPRSQDILDQDTLPASEIISDLMKISTQVSVFLKNDNLRVFYVTVGRRLFNILLEHYKKFQVNSMGGIIVTKDIIGIQNAIEPWNISELNDCFATLRELANLFSVQPDLLESLMKEGHLLKVERSTITEYVYRREDFNNESFVTKFKLNLKI
ncbi:LAMI_0H18404g1_1 [Lachancea mirantina]|uniref:LAMI_0H18404g1_1 n=1 Tax=Lachancea mirantina TaxID=1230905 RepID=A0A1G4KJP3_9SACH|nr:LAMI_0H18404g1_1 [Lachancea mirantina]